MKQCLKEVLSERKKAMSMQRLKEFRLAVTVVKSIEQPESDKNHRTIKPIEIVRNNQYNSRRECSDGQFGNKRNNQHG